ncbi:MAG: hypothetical protein ABIR28_10535 [Vicinamibacteria bacterium]
MIDAEQDAPVFVSRAFQLMDQRLAQSRARERPDDLARLAFDAIHTEQRDRRLLRGLALCA